MRIKEWSKEELINRYVFDVARRLPVAQRDEIEREIHAVIDEMVEAKVDGIIGKKQVEEVLYELGQPSRLADTYRGEKRYLIGPEHYDDYVSLLKIVVPIVITVVFVVTIIEFMFVEHPAILDLVISLSASVTSAAFQSFTWTTIAFALVSYHQIHSSKEKQEWSLASLPAIPDRNLRIKKSEPIFSIVGLVFGTVLLFTIPQMIGVYLKNDVARVVSVFNIPVLQTLKLAIVVVILLVLTEQILKLFFGEYTMKLALVLTTLQIVGTSISIYIVSFPGLWNEHFLSIINSYTSVNIVVFPTASQLPLFFILIMVVSVLIDNAVMYYKLLRYR